MLNQSLKGIFKGEFTEVVLKCVESDLPKDSNATVVDVRNNPNYNEVDCIVLFDSEELCKEVEKNISNGYYLVSKKYDDNSLKPTVLSILTSDYKSCDEDVKYSIRYDM